MLQLSNFAFLFRKTNRQIIRRIGKTDEIRIPLLRLSACPTRVGPVEQPTSPARAKRANISVPPLGIEPAERDIAPGQRMPTENPQTPHPIRPIRGMGDREITR